MNPPTGPYAQKILTAFMAAHGLTASDLGNLLKPPVKGNTVVRWCDGSRRPPGSYRKQISVILQKAIATYAWMTPDEIYESMMKHVWLTTSSSDGKKPDAATNADNVHHERHDPSPDGAGTRDGSTIQSRSTGVRGSAAHAPEDSEESDEDEESLSDEDSTSGEHEDTFESNEDSEDDVVSEHEGDSLGAERDSESVERRQKTRRSAAASRSSMHGNNKKNDDADSAAPPKSFPILDPILAIRSPDKHGECSSDNILERIRNRTGELFEVVDAKGNVLSRHHDIVDAKRMLDENFRQRRGPRSMRCLLCKKVLAAHAPISASADKRLAKALERKVHPPESHDA